MSIQHSIRRISIALALGAALQQSAGWDEGALPAPAIELRSAISRDGLVFRDGGKVIIEGGAAPDLVRLSQGDILLLFDFTPPTSSPGASVLAVVRSRDNGRTWSNPEPIRFHGKGADEIAAAHGDLLLMKDGAMRLFFRSEHRGDTVIRSAVTRDGMNYRLEDDIHVRFPRASDLHLTTFRFGGLVHLYAAGLDEPWDAPGLNRAATWHCISRDGEHFTRTGPRPTPGFNFVGDVVDHDSQVRAYVSSGDAIMSLVSRNGKDWRREDGTRLVGGRNPAVIRLRDRAFLMVYEAVIPQEAPPPIEPIDEPSDVYPDSMDVAARHDELPPIDAASEPEAPWPLPDEAWGDAEIAELSGGVDGEDADWREREEAYTSSDGSSPSPANADPRAGRSGAGGSSSNAPPVLQLAPGAEDAPHHDEPAETAHADAYENLSGSENALIADAGGVPSSDTIEFTSGRGDAEPSENSAATAEPDDVATGSSDRKANGTDSDRSPAAADEPVVDLVDRDEPEPFDWSDYDPSDFVPPPDFETPMDYSEWYETKLLDHPEDNAYDAYAEFIPGPHDEPGSKPEWPEFRDMFNDRDYGKPPGPWDPADHPEWEQSNADVQDLLEKFRKATEREGYSQPPIRPANDSEMPGAEERLLITLLLPAIHSHRQLVKATLADAWRMGEEGRVSPQAMLDAWRTALRGATHLTHGVTFIEELVALAQRNLVRVNVRWALEEGVFTSAEELEAALEVLLTYDRTDPDPTRGLRGEHAAAMDLTQYVFKPTRPGAPPQLNPDHLEVMLAWGTSPEDREEVMAQLASLEADDVHAATAAIDGYYRELADLLRTGYPKVRAADVEALLQRYALDKWARTILPGFDRIHQLRARGIAARRATQLVVAVHLFKGHHGRWPASIDELPPDRLAEFRIDPFTGRDFIYRLGDDGPTIYSASENGIDDGGSHSPRWDRDIEAGESDDYVFWPPQHEGAQ